MKKHLINITFLIILFPIIVFAKTIDTTKTSKLEINYIYNDEIKLSNVKFNIYKIADYDNEGNEIIISPLTKYNLSFENDINSYSNLIYSYIISENISPTKIMETDINGTEKTSDLEVGIYLITGESKTINNYIYTPNNYLVTIPYDNNGTMSYDLISIPKVLREEIKEDPEEVKFTSKNLLISWNDNNNYLQLRPKMLKFQLLQNGILYEEIVLNEDNNWRYVWNDLPVNDEIGSNYTYTIVPLPVDDYTINLDISDNGFYITNTINKNENTKEEIINNSDDNPKEKTDNKNDNPEEIIDNKDDDVKENVDNITNYKIPNVSLLWWPFYICFFIGIALLSLELLNITFLNKFTKRKVYIIITTLFIVIALIFLGYNIYISIKSKNKMNTVYNELIKNISDNNFEYNEYTSLPKVNINNEDYIGYLSIPSLDYNVPILNERKDTSNLPSKFYGSSYANNMYICSKNYYDLFINLKKLKIGDDISFTDLDGNIFNYTVTEIDIVKNKNIYEELKHNDGLLLFTSNIYSFNKVLIINCKLKNTY